LEHEVGEEREQQDQPEPGEQPADDERRHQPSCPELSADRSPSLTSARQSTVMNTATLGHTSGQFDSVITPALPANGLKLKRLPNVEESRLPQLAVGSLIPKFSDESAASSTITLAASRPAHTVTGPSRWGRMCFRRMRTSRCPIMRAASTNSRSRSSCTSTRHTRAG